ncbi:MAG: hypothetical protein GC159_10875 [Phycisphaera sp.]|nr:hypothetical protein [Phycisphaera sp.]
MSNQAPQTLRIPLYKLNYVDEILDVPLTKDELDNFYEVYDQNEVQAIKDALDWAAEHPDFAFTGLISGTTKFSDRDAYQYLANLRRQLH